MSATSILGRAAILVGADTSKFGKELGPVEKDSEETGKRAGSKLGKAMAVGLAAAGIGVAVGKALYDIGATFDDVSDTIRVGTGATGEALAELEQSAKNVGREVPAAFEDIGTVIADVNTRLGLTGPTLETLSSQILEAGRIMGEEIDINKLSASFNAFKITGEDTTSAMDHLYRVSQATGVGINELAANVSSNAPAVQALGFSFEETAALVGNLDKAGLNSSKMMMGLSKGLIEVAKSGEEPQEAFRRVVDEMQGFIDSGDKASAIDLASSLFGTRNATQFIGALESGALAMDDLASVAGMTEDTLLGAGKETMDFAEQWQIFKNQALLAIEPIASRVFALISDGMAWINANAVPAMERFIEEWKNGVGPGGRLKEVIVAITDGVMSFTGFLRDNKGAVLGFTATIAALVAVTKAHAAVMAVQGAGGIAKWIAQTNLAKVATSTWTAVQWLLNAALNANSIGIVVVLIAGLVAGLVIAYKKSETFRNIVTGAWEAVKGAVEGVVSWFTDTAWPAIQSFWDSLSEGAKALWGYIQTAWDGIKTAISAVVDWITGTAWPFVKGVFDKIGAAAKFLYVNFIRPQWILIQLAIDAVVKWLKDTAWPFVKKVFDWIGEAAKWLYEKAIKPAWEGIQKGISAVVDWLKNTAWPFIKQVWDWIAAGAKWLWENGIKPAWDGIKGGIEAVVNWLMNTAWPAIKSAWDKIAAGAKWMWDNGIKPAFDNFKNGIRVVVDAVGTAKDAIARVWGKITDAISGPLDTARKFINDKFISPLNKLFETLKMSLRIPLIGGGSSGARGAQGVSSSGGSMLAMASGGTVPGFSPHPKADNIPIWATAGEFMLPVNATKRLMSQVGSTGMEMLRRGQIPGYALGGLVDWAKEKGSAAVGWIKEKGTDIIDLASKAWDVISNPMGYLRDFATQALAGIGDNPLVQAMSAGASRIIDSLVAKIKEWFGGGGGGGDRGGNNMGWQAMKAWFESTFPGKRITSGYRPGAVSVTGITSDHALGRAIDMPASMEIFNKIDSTWKDIRQLLYSPAGSRQIRGGRRSDTIGSPLRAQHWDHVHWSMADGGWVPPFKPFVADRGAILAPGLNLLDNRTGGPEPLARTDVAQRLHPDDIRALAGAQRLHPDDIRALATATAQAVERGAYLGVSEIGRGLALSGGRY